MWPQFSTLYFPLLVPTPWYYNLFAVISWLCFSLYTSQTSLLNHTPWPLPWRLPSLIWKWAELEVCRPSTPFSLLGLLSTAGDACWVSDSSQLFQSPSCQPLSLWLSSTYPYSSSSTAHELLPLLLWGFPHFLFSAPQNWCFLLTPASLLPHSPSATVFLLRVLVSSVTFFSKHWFEDLLCIRPSSRCCI